MAALGPPTWDADAWSTDAWADNSWEVTASGATADLIPVLAEVILQHQDNPTVRQFLSFLRGV